MTYRQTMRSCYLANVTQAAVVNLAPILFVIFQSEFGLSYQQIGALSLINFLTQLIVDALAVKAVDTIRHWFMRKFSAGLYIACCLPFHLARAVFCPLPASGGIRHRRRACRSNCEPHCQFIANGK